MTTMRLMATGIAAILMQGTPAAAQNGTIVAESGQAGTIYAALAPRVIAAEVVADAVVDRAVRLAPAASPGLAPGFARFYVTAQLTALIRGPSGMAPGVAYLADVPLDSRGRPPRLRRLRVLLLARRVPARPGELQLVAPDAQMAWTPALDAQVRSLVREVVAPDAAPAITGVGSAFHVAGTLPGESETQIFLVTATGAPASLAILRRPNEPPRWSVALSEIVDEAAAPPPRDTLLWYRLACGLPATLPDASTASLEGAAATAARADYAVVRAALGPCA